MKVKKLSSFLCILGCSLIVLASGCSNQDFVEFGGIVTWNGEPVPGVMMTFRPIGGEVRSSTAVTGEDGRFKAACTATISGVMSGDNDVTFKFEPGLDMWSTGDSGMSPKLARTVGKYCKDNGPIRITVSGSQSDYKFELPAAE